MWVTLAGNYRMPMRFTAHDMSDSEFLYFWQRKSVGYQCNVVEILGAENFQSKSYVF